MIHRAENGCIGRGEVKAQVKLRFKTVNDKPIICIRALQLIQKANTQSIKTLDSVLEEIILMDKIENSLEAEARGDVLTEEEMDKLVESW